MLLMIVLYYQTKTPISFWCRRGLNIRFLIQPSETLPVDGDQLQKAVEVLFEMKGLGLSPNSITYSMPIVMYCRNKTKALLSISIICIDSF